MVDELDALASETCFLQHQEGLLFGTPGSPFRSADLSLKFTVLVLMGELFMHVTALAV